MKKLQKFDQINVIPFIDIMLVLLVMVLTTSTFIKQGIIPVDLPHSKGAQAKNEKKKELTIYITKDNKIFLDKNEVTPVELQDRLSTMDKESEIILRSDKDSTFQEFVSVMNILKKLQLEQIYIITKE
ncbi:MAG: biopolymer transporter ExbD [Campylobacterota bacterium]|nr:biopolymer transporter ExbD [Campylobacterota bacterium]